MERLNVFVTDDYKDKSGEKKTFFTQIGNAVPHKKGGGTTVYLRPGISVSGDFVIFPPNADAPDKGNQQGGSSNQWDDDIPY